MQARRSTFVGVALVVVLLAVTGCDKGAEPASKAKQNKAAKLAIAATKVDEEQADKPATAELATNERVGLAGK